MNEKTNFEKEINGKQVSLFTLKNKSGMTASITNFGGKLVSLYAPDKDGTLVDVILGYDSIDGYLSGHPYHGATIGRFGNRIAGAQFELEGCKYTFSQNNGVNHLHGGQNGFHNVVWDAQQTGQSLKLTYFSIDGEEGYPGNLSATVTYTLTDENELRIDFQATTDKTTVVNLTHHSYFNLAGEGNGDILDHQLTIFADQFIPTDEMAIPLGQVQSVKNTPFDFTSQKPIGQNINDNDEQLSFGKGYDHTFVIGNDDGKLKKAAIVFDPKSGRAMEVITTQPGMQLYTGNYLDGEKGKDDNSYNYRSAVCFETQHFPDSPNQKTFPSSVLKPGQEYKQTCIYKFFVKQ